MAVAAVAPLLVALAVFSGCAGRSPEAAWGARWPTADDLGNAAVTAARSPATWASLAGAALLTLGDLDEDLSEWGADHAPLFGDDADSISDDLRSVAVASWLITSLVAPSEGLPDKAGGLAVGAATLVLEEGVTNGIKAASNRTRPDGTDDKSFTSGHAGKASAAATLARRNLDYMDMPGWLDSSLRIGLHGVAFGTGWARVEAGKHHVTDVLAGYAVGHFLATFMHASFMNKAFMNEPPMRSTLPPVEVRYHPLDGGGGAVTVVFRGL